MSFPLAPQHKNDYATYYLRNHPDASRFPSDTQKATARACVIRGQAA